MVPMHIAMKRIAALPLPQDQRDAIAKAVAEHYAAHKLSCEKVDAMRLALKPAAPRLYSHCGNGVWRGEISAQSLEYALVYAQERIKYINADNLPKANRKALRKKRSELLAQLEAIDHELEQSK